MKYISLFTGLIFVFLLNSCSSEQSIQEYYVSNAENPNFISFDLPPSLLNIDQAGLTAQQKQSLGTLKKLNILAFQKKEENSTDFELEKNKVKSILKNADYSELMKMNTDFGKATIQVKGDDDTLDELIIYGNNNEKGFVLIRVLGDDMNPASLIQIMQVMQKSGNSGKGLERLGEIFDM